MEEMLQDQDIVTSKIILLINSQTWHAFCSQDEQKTIILQPTFAKNYIAVMGFF